MTTPELHPPLALKIPAGFGQPGEARSPVTIRHQVAWGEMDAFGHVNNAVYFTWFESARIHYFGLVGIDASMREVGIGPILAHADCSFRAPVDYPDELLVRVTTTRIGGSSFTQKYAAYSIAQGNIVADGGGVIVMVDYKKGGKVRVPEPIRAAIRALEGEGLEEG